MEVGTIVFIKPMKKNGIVIECESFPHGRVPLTWPLVMIQDAAFGGTFAEFFDPDCLEILPKIEEQVMEVRMHQKGNHFHMVWIKLRDDRDPKNLIWAISDSSEKGNCLNRNLKWEFEPMPSNRTDEWRKRCRFSLEEAKELVYKYFRSK